MRVIGVTSPLGSPVIEFTVTHGSHPDVTLWEVGYVPIRPLSASRTDDDVIVIMLIRAANKTDRPQRHRPKLIESPPDHEVPIVHQRVAAYALVTSSKGLLGTVCSTRTSAAGVWMLPGGGLNDGEAPADAVMREIHEETGQVARLDRLLTLQSDHWVGRSPAGALEDFHALRIIYAATCDTPTDPVVHDHGGTTQHAAWVPRSKWRALPWTAGARVLLTEHASHAW